MIYSPTLRHNVHETADEASTNALKHLNPGAWIYVWETPEGFTWTAIDRCPPGCHLVRRGRKRHRARRPAHLWNLGHWEFFESGIEGAAEPEGEA